LQGLLRYWTIDGIRVYNASRGEMISCCGDYSKLRKILDMLKSDKFMGKLRDRHYVTVVYPCNIESLDKEMYYAVIECSIGGMIYCYYQNEAGDDIVVFHDTFNQCFRWLYSDKTYIMTLSKLSARVL